MSMFSTPKHDYLVKIGRYQGVSDQCFYSIGFGVYNGFQSCYDTTVIVNENPFKLINTIITIVNKFISENKVDGFIFSFTGDVTKNKQRLKLYQRSIIRIYPNTSIEFVDGIYFIKI